MSPPKRLSFGKQSQFKFPPCCGRAGLSLRQYKCRAALRLSDFELIPVPSLHTVITMSLRPDGRNDRRKKGFKKGIDADDAKKKREDDIVALRKSMRDENLQKKRAVFGGGTALAAEDSTRGAAATQQKVESDAVAQKVVAVRSSVLALLY